MSDDDRERPQRVRFNKLQEAQLPDLVQLELETTAMYHEVGFDAAEVPPRSQMDIAQLTRQHSVIVAEADHLVAGYTAWRDEPPGIAFIEEVGVRPEYQRFGIGAALVEKVREEARACNIAFLALRTWDKASWAAAFYAKLGFHGLAHGPDAQGEDSAPEKVKAWFDAKNEGRPVLRPGESMLYAEVGEPPAANDGEEREDGEPPDDVA